MEILISCLSVTSLAAQKAEPAQENAGVQADRAKPAVVPASGWGTASGRRNDATGTALDVWRLSMRAHVNGRHGQLECWHFPTGDKLRMDLPFTRCGSIEDLSYRDFLVSGSKVDAKGKLSRGQILLVRMHAGKPGRIQVLASRVYESFDANVVRWNRIEGRLYVVDATQRRLLCADWPGRRARNSLPKEAEFVQILDSKSYPASAFLGSPGVYCPQFETGIVLGEYSHVHLEDGKWTVGGTRLFERYDQMHPVLEDGLRRARSAVLPFMDKDAKGQSIETGILEVPSNPTREPSQLRWVDHGSGKSLALDLPFQRFGSIREIGEHIYLLAGSSVDEKGLVTGGHILVVRMTPWALRRFEVLHKQDYPGIDTFACAWNQTDSHLYVLDADARRILRAPLSGIGKESKLPDPDGWEPIGDRRSMPPLSEALGQNLYVHKDLPGVVLTGLAAGLSWRVQQDGKWVTKWYRVSQQLPKPDQPAGR